LLRNPVLAKLGTGWMLVMANKVTSRGQIHAATLKGVAARHHHSAVADRNEGGERGDLFTCLVPQEKHFSRYACFEGVRKLEFC